MDHKKSPILIIDHELNTEKGGQKSLQNVMNILRDWRYQIIESKDALDGLLIFNRHAEISCVLVEWEVKSIFEDQIINCRKVIEEITKRNKDIPIFITTTQRHKFQDVSSELLNKVEGYLWKMEDTADFIAGRIDKAAEKYIEKLKPAFFKKLEQYVREYKFAWHTPGHAGGVAFLKSPAGRLFLDFFGETVFRADLSVSVPELGSLMEHTGVNGEAERNAAKIFGAEYTFFVTNGTSTANKIVSHSCVNRGDIVLVDRNCHKSLQHAITMTGAIPIYFIPSRNAYGIIGGIDYSEFDPKTIEKKIEDCPLVSDNPKKIKLAVVTNSTYDGLIYDVVKIKEKLGTHVENLLFDEAWYAYANFHPIYQNRYAMCPVHEKWHPTLFSTQSTHKLLAAFSQASMIHIKNGNKEVDPNIFNEAFMMHTSTSPQYNIIASLDVAAKMMEKPAGETLIQDIIDEAIIFRRKMIEIQMEIFRKEKDESKKWWFSIWQPGLEPVSIKEKKTLPLKHEESPAASSAEYWTLNSEDTWHGYSPIENEFMMLDPIKVTFLTPGVNIDGSMDEWGIPAPIVSQFLMTRGIVDEKTGFYTFLALFSLGISCGKSSILLSAFFDFKTYYDQNLLLEEVLPDLVWQNTKRYAGMRIKDLADEMHAHLKKENISKLTLEVFSILPKPSMAPWQAYEYLKDRKVEEVPLSEMMGRTVAVMLVPYPPGIPIIMPGETITKESKPILDYLSVFEELDNAFPGFATETHGVHVKEENGRIRYYVNCITK